MNVRQRKVSDMSISALSNASALAVLKVSAQSSSVQSGANASGSTSSNSTQWALSGFFAANDPGNAIKAILAQAQIAQQTQKGTSGGSTAAVNAVAAYTEQMSSSASLLQDVLDTNGETPVSQINAFSLTNSSSDGLSIDMGRQTVYPDLTIGVSSSVIATPVASSTDASSGLQADYLQLSASVAIQSPDRSASLDVALGFSVQGLGQLTATSGVEIQAHTPDAQHNWSDFFQLNVVLDNQASFVTLNIHGLDETQAQSIMTAFQSSAAQAGVGAYAGPNYDPNLSVSYFAGSWDGASSPAG